MKCLAIVFVLVAGLAPSAEAQPHCSKFDPSFCATVINQPEFDTKTLSRFDLELTQPIENLSIEIAWYSQSDDLKITTVPEKVTHVSSTLIGVDGVLTLVDDISYIEIRGMKNSSNLFISIPISVQYLP